LTSIHQDIIVLILLFLYRNFKNYITGASLSVHLSTVSVLGMNVIYTDLLFFCVNIGMKSITNLASVWQTSEVGVTLEPCSVGL
jgi:hypothetical protein